MKSFGIGVKDRKSWLWETNMLERIEKKWITPGHLDVAFMNLRACMDASEDL